MTSISTVRPAARVSSMSSGRRSSPGAGARGATSSSWRSVRQHRAQLLECFLRRRLDRAQRRARLFWLAVHEVKPHAGLDVDERDVVADHVVQVPGDPQPLLALVAALIELTAGSGRGHPLGPDPGRLGRDRHRQQPPSERQRVVCRHRIPVNERGEPDRPDEGERQRQPGQVALPGGGRHEERDDEAHMSQAGARRRERRGEGHPQHQHRMAAPRDQGHRADHEQHPVHGPEGARRTEQVPPALDGRGRGELHREQHERQREIPAQAQRPRPPRHAGRPSG